VIVKYFRESNWKDGRRFLAGAQIVYNTRTESALLGARGSASPTNMGLRGHAGPAFEKRNL
jgi:hypothetical protein